MLDALTAEQWARWKLFHDLEPWGSGIEDQRLGMLRQTVLAPHSRRLPSVHDLVPQWQFGSRTRVAAKPRQDAIDAQLTTFRSAYRKGVKAVN